MEVLRVLFVLHVVSGGMMWKKDRHKAQTQKDRHVVRTDMLSCLAVLLVFRSLGVVVLDVRWGL